MKTFNYVEPQIFSLVSFSGSSGTTGVGHLQTRKKKKKSVLSGKHDIHHLLVWVLFLGYTVKQGSWPLQHPRSRISGCTWQGRAPLVATSPRVPCCSTRSPSSSPFFFPGGFRLVPRSTSQEADPRLKIKGLRTLSAAAAECLSQRVAATGRRTLRTACRTYSRPPPASAVSAHTAP